MNRFRIFACLVLLPTLLSACAGRSAVISEMNRYAPPPVYAAPIAPAVPSASAPDRRISPPSIDWPALKEKWEKNISAPLPEKEITGVSW